MAEAEGSLTGKAAMLAAILKSSSSTPAELTSKARSRFRCISWDALLNRREIICQGVGRPDSYQIAGADLYNLSESCQFTECDAFLSHSWHDDAELKWAALESWCEAFRCQHGRAPRIWLDKVCIDQTDIAADLECLPVFLAACQGILVICGHTYTSRLWCVLELFVYFSIIDAEEDGFATTVLPLSRSADEIVGVVQSWQHFSASDCQCFDPEDKQNILHLISNAPGGIASFDRHVTELARRMLCTQELPNVVDPDNLSKTSL
eukprot:TRINITY_DN20425_c0_g1_i1.p1 TRINITY_DN20425_c0_g1~~TRINITY_DN20425_c0_g1_i1.p1  ORF type:complete len:292 (+),score=42.34 TRINITY_DN20425_c0_g1_i1:86-877(+)